MSGRSGISKSRKESTGWGRALVRTPVLVAACLLFTGCTFLGQPSVVNLSKTELGKHSIAARLRVRSISAETNAGINVIVATANVGRFSETDVRAIRESLEKEFARISDGQGTEVAVDVVFSRYVQAFSNSHVSLGAVIDYCVTIGNRRVFADRFYAAHNKGLGITPFGMVKDEFNKRILERIVEDTVAVATEREPARKFEGTFNDFELVLAILPDRIYGEHPFYISPKPSVSVDWRKLLDVPAAKWE